MHSVAQNTHSDLAKDLSTYGLDTKEYTTINHKVHNGNQMESSIRIKARQVVKKPGYTEKPFYSNPIRQKSAVCRNPFFNKKNNAVYEKMMKQKNLIA